MSLIRDRVNLADVKNYFTARTGAKSGLSGQIEMLKSGGPGGHDPISAQSRAEIRLLQDASVYRCVDALAVHENCRFAPCADLKRFAAKIRAPDGAVAVAVLHAYMPWDTQWRLRGIVHVYNWMRTMTPDLPPIDVGAEADESQAIRAGLGKNASKKAQALLADAEVVLSAWVDRWNNGRQKEEHQRDRNDGFQAGALKHLAEERWVPLSELVAEDGPAMTTMREWCQLGKLPASKRGGGRWWVNVQKLKVDFDLEKEEENVWYQQLVSKSFARNNGNDG